MFKIMKMALCVSLIVALAAPAFAAAKGSNKSFTSDVVGSVYSTGANAVDTADGFVNSALKRTFSLFNPCLDAIKFCSDRVFAPIQMPIDYVEGKIYKTKPAYKKAVAVPTPLKPVMPK
jgi:hypothetical protein